MTVILPLGDIGIRHRVALSCIGAGGVAHLDAMRTGRSGLRLCDYRDVPLPGFIGRVEGVEDTTLPPGLEVYRNRATQLAVMAMAAEDFEGRVRDAIGRWGAGRVGLVMGTSTSGVEHLEELYRARADEEPLPPDYQIRHHNDHHAVTAFLDEWLGFGGPVFTISTACSSSAKAMVDAAQLIQLGLCDAVLAGGVDSLCRTSLHGFDALELLAPAPCQPFDANREGIAIGEGAGFVLLERGGDGPRLSGYGESSDAINMSTPPPDGAGAALAMHRALDRAGLAPGEIGYVKLHGTGTAANDSAEGTAVATVFGDVPASSLKGMIGHTLGAAGALEAVICLDAIEADLLPGTTGLNTPDPDIPLAALRQARPGHARHAVANAFGFGGSNCALVLSRA